MAEAIASVHVSDINSSLEKRSKKMTADLTVQALKFEDLGCGIDGAPQRLVSSWKSKILPHFQYKALCLPVEALRTICNCLTPIIRYLVVVKISDQCCKGSRPEQLFCALISGLYREISLHTCLETWQTLRY